MKFKFRPEDFSKADLERSKSATQTAQKWTEAGFWTQALEPQMWAQVRKRADELRGRASRFVICGVGGSSLGAKTLTTLTHDRNVYYLDHLDPESVQAFRQRLGNLSDVHWIWVSKSGTTLETLTNLQLAAGWCKDSGIRIEKNSTVVAEPRPSPLVNWAKKNDVPCSDILSNVSGRFSVLTAAGLLPAAVSGVDLNELERGARSVDPAGETVAKLVSATLKSWERGEWITSIWTYCDRLRPFTYWMQQLWAESLAKAVKRDGSPAPRASFPVPSVGSIDQHSLLQQFIEGHKSNWLWFIRVDDLENSGETVREVITPETSWLKGRKLGEVFGAQAEGTAQALAEAKISLLEWHWPRVDAFHMGQALMTIEITVAALGERMGIHTYNQPGVERGKVITLDLLRG
jgi:glucose-6-phosphate isomerase